MVPKQIAQIEFGIRMGPRINIYCLLFRPILATRAGISGPGFVGAGFMGVGFMEVRFAWARFAGGRFAWAGFAGAGFIRAGSIGGVIAVKDS